MLTLIESGLLSGLVPKAELRELLDELYGDDFSGITFDVSAGF